jgi:hypothetical protein
MRKDKRKQLETELSTIIQFGACNGGQVNDDLRNRAYHITHLLKQPEIDFELKLIKGGLE